MLTVKYRSFVPTSPQVAGAPIEFVAHEQIHTGFDMVSQEIEEGNMVVHAHRGGDPGMMFGPWLQPELSPEEIAEFEKQSNLAGQGRTDAPAPLRHPTPRPTVWVMNENGATVARYDL